MNREKTYNGSCFCGEVQFTVTSEPALMAYCHCDSCRKWSAGPVSAFTLWKSETLKVTQGEDNIGSYNKTPESTRKWCKSCGGHLCTEHPNMALTPSGRIVVASPDFPFKPVLHVNYQETVLRMKDGLPKMKDGLPKMKDLPKEAGGSGDLLAE